MLDGKKFLFGMTIPGRVGRAGESESAMKISYGPSSEALKGFEQFIRSVIDERGDIRTVCDVGGGANPVLAADYVREKNLDYTVLDISAAELEKAPANYHKICADIAAPACELGKRFDLVFSKMVAEHIPNAEQFHRNVFNSLNDNGLAIHFFPTLYTLPFAVNRVIPESFSSALLNVFAPRDRHQHDKFPAYYHWCRGPIPSQIRRLTGLGYEIVHYRGFFGHPRYYRHLKPLQMLHQMKTNRLLKKPNPYLTSYAYIVLRRPDVPAAVLATPERSAAV